MSKRGTPTPSLALMAKLGSIAGHVEEYLSPESHPFDRLALRGLIEDPEVRQFMDDMRKLALIPVRRG